MKPSGCEPGNIEKASWIEHHSLKQAIDSANPQLGEISEIASQVRRPNGCQAKHPRTPHLVSQ